MKSRISKRIGKAIINAFQENLNESYYLVYTDYQDNYESSPEIIQKCLNTYSPEPLYDNNWEADARYEECLSELESLKDKILSNIKYSHIHDYIEEWLEDNKDQIIELIESRDNSDPIGEMLSRTKVRARVTLYTNYDCLPGIYDMRKTYCYYEYFKDIVDILYLNPALVKRIFNKHGIFTRGSWPNKTYRNGNEAVLYEEFAEEILNQSCYGLLTFMGMLPLINLYETRFQECKKILVPKNNSCGMFNFWNGGGSLMEMKLQRNLIIPVSFPKKTRWDHCSVCVDERKCNDGYCIDEVYGMVTSVWGKEFSLIYQNGKN